MNKKFTPKQIEKYKRQKYIAALEKCTKNLFRLFRDEKSTLKNYKDKFTKLKKELESLDTIRLDTEYLKKTKEYIDLLYKDTILNENFEQNDYQNIKSEQLTNLNRLQKMKNQRKYNKNRLKEDIF